MNRYARTLAPPLAIALAFVFGPLAFLDLRVEDFRDAFPRWMPAATGGLEVVGAILLLVPAARSFGATTIGAVMAMALLHRVDAGGQWVVPAALLSASAIVAFGSLDE